MAKKRSGMKTAATRKRSLSVRAATPGRVATGRPARVGTIGRKRAMRVVVRAGAAPRRMDVVAKGLTLALEPPLDASIASLSPAFHSRLKAALDELAAAGQPFKLVEGFRTVERQQWLFGSGRPSAQPFGRPGAIVTNADGVIKRSRHQGTGVAGSGTAADCYPTRNGRVFIPPSSDPIWAAYAAAVVRHGLVAGHNFRSIKDSPHAELD
jgi:hypothetical protein